MIEDGCLVSMNATVPEGREYVPRSLIVGAPAKRSGEAPEEQT